MSIVDVGEGTTTLDLLATADYSRRAGLGGDSSPPTVRKIVPTSGDGIQSQVVVTQPLVAQTYSLLSIKGILVELSGQLPRHFCGHAGLKSTGISHGIRGVDIRRCNGLSASSVRSGAAPECGVNDISMVS
ncbi:hypothetical protein CHU98_g5859 [Xylaria longipes]|nr:hypothetical protein CHU98_g5859 [Xylaria longipes]